MWTTSPVWGAVPEEMPVPEWILKVLKLKGFFKNFRLFFCSDTSKKEFLALMLWTALFFVVITGNWPENEGGEMWSHEMRCSYRDTAFMFDEEPQGVIFSLARAQHWLRCVALLLGSLSTYCCLSARCADAGIQPHRDLCLPHPTGILGTSGTEPQRSVLIHQQWYSGLPRTGDACVALAALAWCGCTSWSYRVLHCGEGASTSRMCRLDDTGTRSEWHQCSHLK